MKTKEIKREIVELSERDHEWAACAVCHLRVACPAVWLGKLVPFRVPTVCVCINCLRAAVELLEHPAGACTAIDPRSGERCASPGPHRGRHYAQDEDCRMITWAAPSARGTYARRWACPCGAKLFTEPKSAKAMDCPNCGRNAWEPLS